ALMIGHADYQALVLRNQLFIGAGVTRLGAGYPLRFNLPIVLLNHARLVAHYSLLNTEYRADLFEPPQMPLAPGQPPGRARLESAPKTAFSRVAAAGVLPA